MHVSTTLRSFQFLRLLIPRQGGVVTAARARSRRFSSAHGHGIRETAPANADREVVGPANDHPGSPSRHTYNTPFRVWLTPEERIGLLRRLLQ